MLGSGSCPLHCLRSLDVHVGRSLRQKECRSLLPVETQRNVYAAHNMMLLKLIIGLFAKEGFYLDEDGGSDEEAGFWLTSLLGLGGFNPLHYLCQARHIPNVWFQVSTGYMYVGGMLTSMIL